MSMAIRFDRVLCGFLLLIFLTANQTVGADKEQGTITDNRGGAIFGAVVEIYTANGIMVYSTSTDHQGSFPLPELSPGRYRLVAKADHFADAETTFQPGGRSSIHIRLSVAPITSTITVAAERGSVGNTRETAQIVAVGAESRIKTIPDLGQALAGAPGILVQQSTLGQVSPFLRGLTGYHVLNLIDGIRFNNSTFRSGPNQYLALIDPNQEERVEAVLGPTGVEYGSDALGGSIYLSTPSSLFARRQLNIHGDLLLNGNTADLSGISAAQFSLSRENISWLGGISVQRANDLRAGDGVDSHHVFHRFLGLDPVTIRDLTGTRLQDTGYSRQGVFSKLAFRLPEAQHLYLWYQGSQLAGVRGYKDLLGGLGRLQSSFAPQTLHFGYVRYEKLEVGPLDSLSATFSINSQRDGSTRKGLGWQDSITMERNRVDVLGFSSQASSHIGRRQVVVFGAEHYYEKIAAERNELQNTISRSVRPLYPNGSRYSTTGLFLKEMFEPIHRKVRLVAGIRYTSVAWHASESELLGIRSASDRFNDLTFQTALSWQTNDFLGMHFLVGRGFRAPNLNDLGAIGLNDLGYEIPAAEASGAFIGSSASETATSTGKQVRPLTPESLYNFESGITLNRGHVHYRIQGFYALFHQPIVRRTLLFAADSIPAILAGVAVKPLMPTPAQSAQGTVTISPLFDARAVKAFVNEGRAKYSGIESLFDWTLTPQWTLRTSYSFLVGRDLDPDRPVRRLPPQSGAFSLRRDQRRFWAEIRLLFAGEQRLLSGGDLDDERIGASRSRRDIAAFFSGARMTAWIDEQGRFRPTHETLADIQNRLLPYGVVVQGTLILNDSTRAPLFPTTPAWWTMDLFGGINLSEKARLGLGMTNLADRNYRIHGSGVDSPGRSLYLSLHYHF